MNPESDCDLKSSNGGSFGLGFNWSCGPQLASMNGVIVCLNRKSCECVHFWVCSAVECYS